MGKRKESLLRVLVYFGNPAHVQALPVEAVRQVDSHFFLDVANDSWTYLHRTDFGCALRTLKIGQGSLAPYRLRRGIIGVYDVADIAQLNAMLYMAHEAVRDPHDMTHSAD